ncbi:MAG: hypothetical protein A2499_01805 [Stygiobacter sp. RIFOXYC12_FULL_38_8]|nr:MAG: hypothetical protein A2X62_01455 [Stygiobacter sp. GWC2_38_9]OGU85680.1 MAG: hypothetical protein A2279_06755 [Stygiobacter sp. RIFOXYA12_FULL_38_9]OGV09788.1 MAG: hypothetical protein A2299_14730 [Stygiobacter sp. RIFOXYB2_FULL_37_11]OGV13657.1 MAG: hypothetical protein A2440_10855 [Stygiobacter sp. RIFOXYC2_FULL_38_25]OGV24835.1 MAG: hypothetical protein A2499_01805 [Stygiobacter sp. RIFOXYC12_FULL_38_8]OGV80041.1 MAG: hypothetical protein A2X65_02805 [Stygiobacter sp. GWF2_38_21]RJ
MFSIKNILVPTDFSSLSQSALEYARDLADNMNAAIHILHVIDKSMPFVPGKQNLSETEIAAALEADARKQLSAFIAETENDTSIKVIGVIKHGIDFEEIVKYTKEIQAELIVIATHGRTGIMHSLLGSVAEKVIQHAKCPVLVIPAGEER